MKAILQGKQKSWAPVLIAFVMMIACVFELASPAVAATWRTGNFPSNNKNTSAITVTLTNKSKDAYVRIHTYTAKNSFEALKSNPATKERSCSVYVTMRDVSGNWIWGGEISSGSGGKKMKLGCDHSVYRLYLKHPYSINCYGGHYCPIYWGVECVTNCSVS